MILAIMTLLANTELVDLGHDDLENVRRAICENLVRQHNAQSGQELENSRKTRPGLVIDDTRRGEVTDGILTSRGLNDNILGVLSLVGFPRISFVTSELLALKIHR